MNFIESIWWIVIGLVVCLVFTYLIRRLWGKITKKGKTDDRSGLIMRITKGIGNFVLAVFSLDYHLAEIQKMPLKREIEMLEESDDTQIEELSLAKSNLANYIESTNMLNLIFSLVLVVVAFVAVYVKCNVFTYIMIGVLCYRILSRTLEINISFVNDICDNVKSSSLSNGKRIKLAIKSLLEEVFLFAAMYAFLINGECNFWQALNGGLHSFTIDVYEVASERLWCSDLFNAVAVWQKACSGILVTLCIVQYFASKDSNVDGGKTN